MSRAAIIFIVAFTASFLGEAGRTVSATEQTIAVRGQVICEKRSLRNVLVELREHDTMDPDDSMNSTHTDKDGFFDLFGIEDEVSAIKPYIRIVHNCDVSKKGACRRTTDFSIPPTKINQLYDMNFVNLNLRGFSDEEKCD